MLPWSGKNIYFLGFMASGKSRAGKAFANLLGWPALALPNGISENGLPTGVQLMGQKDSEDRLFKLGHQLEQALGWVSKLGIEPNQKA